MTITLPNVRKLFTPDPGFTMVEADLKGADAQVVAWEADDADLKAAFRAGLDIHEHNCEAMLGSRFTSLPSGSHARDKLRQDHKKAIHLVNYGGTSRTCAASLGWLVIDAARFQRRWFDLHPGILQWHNRIKRALETDRTVWNKFGFRRVFFDRIDACFAEALAWPPQSTVALNTYHSALKFEAHYWPEQLRPGWLPTSVLDLEGMLLQTHDSLNFQFRNDRLPTATAMQSVLAITIPYDDPLTIPWALKRSTRSWGELEKYT